MKNLINKYSNINIRYSNLLNIKKNKQIIKLSILIITYSITIKDIAD